MKIIGMLGGTGWSSTIGYYTILNEIVGKKLGGYHSAKIILKSIDYHDIMACYGKDHDRTAKLLEHELRGLIDLKPDGIIICCNSLHKYFDIIKEKLEIKIPVFHAVDLVSVEMQRSMYKNCLLLATKFTMEDGFFASKIRGNGFEVVIPDEEERNQINIIHSRLMHNDVIEEDKQYFAALIDKYKYLDAVIVGCTEFPLVVSQENSALPIINPVYLQGEAAVDFALSDS